MRLYSVPSLSMVFDFGKASKRLRPREGDSNSALLLTSQSSYRYCYLVVTLLLLNFWLYLGTFIFSATAIIPTYCILSSLRTKNETLFLRVSQFSSIIKIAYCSGLSHLYSLI